MLEEFAFGDERAIVTLIGLFAPHTEIGLEWQIGVS